MNNSIYNLIGTPLSGQMQNMLVKYREFSRNFKGNPQQIVEDMLKTGRMTQAQYNALQEPAKKLYKALGL